MRLLKNLPANELFPMLLELLDKGLPASFTVSGMSMWPLIRGGKDVVFLKKCNPQKMKNGDIVLLHTPDSIYLLHRIVKISKDGYTTAGDSKCRVDGTFPKDCVKAQVDIVCKGKRRIHCNRFYWRILFTVWRLLFPVRRQIFGVYNFITGNKKN